MKTIVLGAGQVGFTVVKSFVDAHPTEPNDITVVDQDGNALKRIRESFACDTVQGDAGHPDVLYEACVDECDVLIAVTGSDETNFVACQIAYTLYDVPNRIARIRQPSYIIHADGKELTCEGFHVTLPVAPELTVVDRILKLIRYPGMVDVTTVVNGQLVGALAEIQVDGEIFSGFPDLTLDSLAKQDIQLLAIKRDGRQIDRDTYGDYQPLVGDLLLLLASETALYKACNQTYRKPKSAFNRIVIAGGGNVGTSLAKEILNKNSSVTIDLIDADEDRAKKIHHELSAGSRLTVMHGDATDLKFLTENRIKDADLFIAVTNNDLVNLVATLQSKILQISAAYTLLANSDYVKPLRRVGIHIPISPQQTTKNIILSAVREKTLASFYDLERFEADLVEVHLSQDSEGSSVAADKRVSDLRMPRGSRVTALVRPAPDSGKLQILSNPRDVILQQDDHVLCLLENHSALHKLERLFRLKPQN